MISSIQFLLFFLQARTQQNLKIDWQKEAALTNEFLQETGTSTNYK